MVRRKSTLVCMLGMLVLFLGAPFTNAQEVVGSLSNFDVINTDDREYDDFELQLRGDIDRDCIEGFYPGWGAPPKVRPGTSFGDGLTVRWADREDPIGPGRMEHFGLRLNCDGPRVVRGFWSIDGRPVREVPLPWQAWRAGDGVIWDVIDLPRGLDAGPVFVQREWVTLPRTIPLERLNWEPVERIVERLGRQWTPVDRRPLPLEPGEPALIKIPVERGDEAVVVRYVVSTRERKIARFINQAILAGGGGPACPSGLPDPQIQITGTEEYTGSDGNPYTRYRLEVTNRAAYPDSMFAPAPSLPPCGLNTNSSRTWVEIRDGNGGYLYGFCGLSDNENLGDLWFARPRGTPPPECISVTLNDRQCNDTHTSQCEPTTGLGPACIDFESLTAGTSFAVGSSFSDSGATMVVDNFQWGNLTWTGGGEARIDSGGLAGGSGNEVQPANANLDFVFPVQPDALHLEFGEYGGNLNLEVNGDFQNFANFADVNGSTIGGTQVAVTNGFGNDQGTLKLTGEINSFSIGGQELWIDRVCLTERPPIDAPGTWVMPWAVGTTRLDRIDATGLLDYTWGPLTLDDSPFGGRLALQLQQAAVVPSAGIYYYRFLHRPEIGGTWEEFDESVSVHYRIETPAQPPSFGTIVLGPNPVSGRKLYRFRPHSSELPSLVTLAPNQTVVYPGSGFPGDVYRGFLNTVAEGLAPGRHHIRLEVYDQAGNMVAPGGGTFRFMVPTATGPNFAPPASIVANGFEFTLHVDNQHTGAQILAPRIGMVGAGSCGFLRYDPTDPPLSPPVQLSFNATHPDNRAVFNFRLYRANAVVGVASVSGAEVSATLAGTAGDFAEYSGDGNGHFQRSFSRGELLGGCIEAAFSQNLRVYAKATNGIHRLSGLDSGNVFAFALTPED